MDMLVQVFHEGYVVDIQNVDIPRNKTRVAAVEVVRNVAHVSGDGVYVVEFTDDDGEVIEHSVQVDYTCTLID